MWPDLSKRTISIKIYQKTVLYTYSFCIDTINNVLYSMDFYQLISQLNKMIIRYCKYKIKYISF